MKHLLPLAILLFIFILAVTFALSPPESRACEILREAKLPTHTMVVNCILRG